MKINNKAFTLVELLVVVLIIGILAAIAVPQYQKAVEKARISEAIMAVEKIAQAQEIYKLATGRYTQDINDLDINMEGEDTSYGGIPAKRGSHFTFAASNNTGNQKIKALAYIRDGYGYTLAINIYDSRVCYIYNGASNYEGELCSNWADITENFRSN